MCKHKQNFIVNFQNILKQSREQYCLNNIKQICLNLETIYRSLAEFTQYVFYAKLSDLDTVRVYACVKLYVGIYVYANKMTTHHVVDL